MDEDVKIRQEMHYDVSGMKKSDIWLVTQHDGYEISGVNYPESFTIHSTSMPVQIHINHFQLEALRVEIIRMQKKIREEVLDNAF